MRYGISRAISLLWSFASKNSTTDLCPLPSGISTGCRSTAVVCAVAEREVPRIMANERTQILFSFIFFRPVFLCLALVEQTPEPTAILVFVDHLCEFARVEPDSMAFVADVDLNVLIIGFHQRTLALRALQIGGFSIFDRKMRS